jgi:hypothetical protein
MQLNASAFGAKVAAGVHVRRAAVSCPNHTTHQHSISTVSQAVHNEDAAVASTSQPDAVGRRSALGLLAITPVLAQARSALAVQVCGHGTCVAPGDTLPVVALDLQLYRFSSAQIRQLTTKRRVSDPAACNAKVCL